MNNNNFYNNYVLKIFLLQNHTHFFPKLPGEARGGLFTEFFFLEKKIFPGKFFPKLTALIFAKQSPLQ